MLKWIYGPGNETVRDLEQVPFLKKSVDHSTAVNGSEKINGIFLKECDVMILSIKIFVLLKLKVIEMKKNRMTSNNQFGNMKSTISKSNNNSSYVAHEEYFEENPDGKNEV